MNVKTVHEAVEDSIGTQTLTAHLLEGFSSMALLIALVGLYGTVAFSVAQRTREFGVRLALGAPQESIRLLVVQKAMLPVLAGLIAGDIILWFATKLIRSYLFGISPHDAATIAIASCTLVATGFIAALIPARRAASIDPMQALRTE
jgi:ABC-type antimicrobial peptide transport system permease subunit